RNFKLFVRNKATRTPYGVYIVQPLLAVIYIIVGFSALLVSADRAMREPQYVERAQTAPRFFFVSVLFHLTS
ncbi:MAG: hypothetical protein IJ936_04735, partial [Peptococcaceae bacterium]|nr:hypothetical protein [Peptococcaceae bacterium]